MDTTTSTPPIAPRIHPKAIRARRNRRLLLVAVSFLLAALGYSWYWWSEARFWVRTDNAYVTGNIIPVKAQATGIVAKVLAEETQFVNKGDVLVGLQEHLAVATLGKARGELGQTVRRIAALFMTRKQLAEKLSARTARLDLVQHDLERYRRASPSGAVSKQILQNAVDKIRALEAEVRETQAELDTLDAQVSRTTVMTHPAVELAKHQLIEAYLEYKRQQILAPVSGYVAKRRAQVGDRVKPGDDLMTIVPLDHLWVEANLRETELEQVRPGQTALVSVDLYGTRQTFHGTVEGLVPGTGSAFALLPPDNATGNFIHIVERVPVRIALPQDEIREHPIRPGLSTITQIKVDEPGQSVWSSLAATSASEYETDIYADELPTAESLAQAVMTANVVSEEEQDRPAVKSGDHAMGKTAAPRATGAAHHPARSETTEHPSGGELQYRERDFTPSSFIPPRSPDLGLPTAPLSPSIGPGSGLLGPEAGPGPSRLRSTPAGKRGMAGAGTEGRSNALGSR